MMVRAAGRGTVIRTWPAGLARKAFTDSSAASKLSSSGRNCTSNRSPASVKATLRVVRFKRRTPSRSSSARKLSLSDERDTPSWVAALAKLSRSAIATKALISAMLAFLIVRYLRMGCADRAGLPNRAQYNSLCTAGSRWRRAVAPTSFFGGTIVTMVSRYHPVLVVLHWFLALFIVAALALGALVLVKIPNTDPMKIEALRSHM